MTVGELYHIVLFGCSFVLALLPPCFYFYPLEKEVVFFICFSATSALLQEQKRNNSRGIVTLCIEEKQKDLVWISSQETEYTVLERT